MCIFISLEKLQYRFFFPSLISFALPILFPDINQKLYIRRQNLQGSATKQKCQCLFPPAWQEHRNCPQIHFLHMQQSKDSSGELLQSLPACCAGCLGSGARGIVAFPLFAQFKSLRASGRNPDSHSGSAKNLQQHFLSLGSVVGELLCSSPLYLP